MSVIWHDLECGSYAEDLPLWRSLADQYGGPVLDVGAGTGRIAIDLARRGHQVTALDSDAELIAELRARSAGLEIDIVLADAREFTLEQRFPLCVMPMQTIQLLGGEEGRAAFLRCARRHLSEAGALAIALTETFELFDAGEGTLVPLPDICERDGIVYSSFPTAVRADRDGVMLERRRETVTVDGQLSIDRDRIRLDHLTSAALEREAGAVGLRALGRLTVEATDDYVGSTVVMLGA